MRAKKMLGDDDDQPGRTGLSDLREHNVASSLLHATAAAVVARRVDAAAAGVSDQLHKFVLGLVQSIF